MCFEIKNNHVYLKINQGLQKPDDDSVAPIMDDDESRSVVSDSLRPHGLHSSWNSLGQNTGVGGQNTGAGSHSLLQGIFPIQGGFFTS